MKTLLGLVAILLLASPAAASAVRGCRIEARVIEVRHGADGIVLAIEVLNAEGFGHSAGPSFCDAPGTRSDFAVDNDEEVEKAAVKAGDVVRLEEMTAYQTPQPGEGPRSFHTQRYTATLPGPTSQPASQPAP